VRVGIGLPNAVPGTPADVLLAWAREGERCGFASLATTDRLVYDSYESLATLAAAAAVTQRCTLLSAVLIAPLRSNAALLAKQAATVDRLSGGRLVLGLAVGLRPDDFAASGIPTAGRAQRFEQQLDEIGRIWAGERRGMAGAIGPTPTLPGGPELVLGGHAPAALARAARRGTGWMSGSGGAGMFAQGAATVRAAWTEATRPGTPRLLALAYVALGAEARAEAERFVHSYYGFAPPLAEQVLRAAAIGDQAVRALIRDYSAAGCDDLVLLPCSPRLEQVEQLALITTAATATVAKP